MSKTNNMNVFESELDEANRELHKTESAIQYVQSQLDLYWGGKSEDSEFIRNLTDFFNAYPFNREVVNEDS